MGDGEGTTLGLAVGIPVGVLGIVLGAVSFLLSKGVGYRSLRESSVRLGEGGYDFGVVKAPQADGLKLRIIATLLTFTGPLGKMLCRKLLNENGLHRMRQLAIQVPPTTCPVWVPMVRLPPAEHQEHVAAAAEAGGAERAVSGPLPGYRGRAGGQAEGFHSVEDYYESYRSGHTTPEEVLARALAAIDRLRPSIGTVFTSVDKEGAAEAARESSRRWHAARPLSMFDGVPIAVKDDIKLKGHRVMCGTRVAGADVDVAHPVAAEDDPLVARFKAAGALVLGLTTMAEFGISNLGYNSHDKGPFNPYGRAHYCGGSSSGSAVAVAAGIVPVAVGFDGGGSIRLPAAMCGQYGLAVTLGRVPCDKAVDLVVKSGPIAASARDAAYAYAVMAPNIAGHPHTVLYGGDGPPPPHLQAFGDIDDLSHVRLGLFQEWFEDADSEVVAACNRALDAMKQRGATVVDITLPHLQALSLSHSASISTGLAQSKDGLFCSVGGSYWNLEPNTRVAIGLASSISAVELHAAEKLRAWALHFYSQVYKKHGLTAIVTPTMFSTAPKMSSGVESNGESNTTLVIKLMKFIFLANFLGNPAISVPVGYGEGGLPIGLHLMAPHWAEARLLQLAHFLEMRLAAPRRRPDHFADLLSGRSN